ncbi:hypothetical protein D3C75_795260 [compost metagenome]
MHAILRIDLEALMTVLLRHHFVHAGRAIPLRGLVVQRQVGGQGDIRIGEP